MNLLASSTWSKATATKLMGKNKTNNNNKPGRPRGISLPNIGLSLPMPGPQRCKHTLNYYPEFLEQGRGKKQREVTVEFWRVDQAPGQFYIQIKGEETIRINIDKHNFCGVQRWQFTKRHSGWVRQPIKKTLIAIVLTDQVHVFQQMNRDCDSTVAAQLENVINDELGVKKWWPCYTSHSSNPQQSPVNLHLTKNSLSMVNGKEFQPSCLKRWNISEIEDCQVVNNDEAKFVIRFKSGCKLKCTSRCASSQEISEMIGKAASRPAPPPRPRPLPPPRCMSLENTLTQDPVVGSVPLARTLPHGFQFDMHPAQQQAHTLPRSFQCNTNTPQVNGLQTTEETQAQETQKRKILRKKSLIRQRSFCSSNYVENEWRGSSVGLDEGLRKSCSSGDIADIKSIELHPWDSHNSVHDTGQDQKAEPNRTHSRKSCRSQKKSTIRRRLDHLARGDQMSIRTSRPVNDVSVDEEAVTKRVSIMEFELPNQQVSDVIYTLKRIMDRLPSEKDTLRIPSGLYHTICFKLIPHFPLAAPGLGKTKDWRDLAERIGFHYNDIQMIASFHYQTPIATPQDILLQCWQDKHNRLQGWLEPACSRDNLFKFLEEMGRWDIMDDIKNSKKKS